MHIDIESSIQFWYEKIVTMIETCIQTFQNTLGCQIHLKQIYYEFISTYYDIVT